NEVEKPLLSDWLSALKKAGADARISEAELNSQTSKLLHLLIAAVSTGLNIDTPGWDEVRGFLEDVSNSRALQGFSSSETALFVFSLRQPLVERLRAKFGSNAAGLLAMTSEAGEII